jgi:uncharacterized membrane protein YcaP (DUF421 family)
MRHFSDARLRFCFGVSPPIVCLDRVPVACLRHSDKGNPHVIVRDGRLDWKAMRRNHISEHDLEEDLRLSAHINDIAEIGVARLERNGDISFIKSGD